MSNNIKEELEKLLLYKGRLIKNKKAFKEYIKEILAKHKVKNPIEAFVMGVVDGMVYDIACSLNFTKQKSQKYRREIINKLWGIK